MNIGQFVSWLEENNVPFTALEITRSKAWLIIKSRELITLPDNLDLGDSLLHIVEMNGISKIPNNLKCGALSIRNSIVSEIPDCLRVKDLINIVGSDVVEVPTQCAEKVVAYQGQLQNNDRWKVLHSEHSDKNPIKTFIRKPEGVK